VDSWLVRSYYKKVALGILFGQRSFKVCEVTENPLVNLLQDVKAVLWSRSRSWSRKEPELLAGAGILKFRLRLPASAQGQTQVVYLTIIHIE
jgi:hypothetical protein